MQMNIMHENLKTHTCVAVARLSPLCVLPQEDGVMLKGRLLHKGSRILAVNGSILEVAVEPEDHEAPASWTFAWLGFLVEACRGTT